MTVFQIFRSASASFLGAGIVLAFASFACSPQTVVQTATPSANAPAQGITVSGTGKVTAPPSIARFTIGVEARAVSAEEAMAQVNAQMARVIAAVKQAGVQDKDVRTATVSLNFERVEQPPPRPMEMTPTLAPQPAPAPAPATSGKSKATAAPKTELRATASEKLPQAPAPAPVAPPANVPQGFYTASNDVEITIRRLDDAGKILTAATSAGANQMYGLRFEIEDPAPLLEEARKRAVADARARAERLAQFAGVRLGPAVSIVETDSGSVPGPMPMFAMRSKAADAPIERGELTVSTSVQVVYELGHK